MLTSGNIWLNQLREAFTSGLTPSEVTSKIAGSISVMNVIGLDTKKKLGNLREFPKIVVNGM